MPNSLLENTPPVEPVGPAPAPQRAWTRWPKWLLLLLLCIWLLDMGISLLIQHSRLQKQLTARLESAFGRPVQIGKYDFTLWTGPALDAQSVTVAEDPRFGHEYFLRAESLRIRLRWRSLLRGRLEPGTLSLTHPSLNLVRNRDGQWNLAQWLPHASGSAETFTGNSLAAGSNSLRFHQIAITGGRINFKRGDEKLLFALTDVQGYVESESPGRWRMDLEASPARAAIIMQQAGMLRMVGHVGGTSSRLRPAVLDLSWTNASVSDVLRLVRSYDYGIRGTGDLSLEARTESDRWTLEGHANVRQLHRWDFAARTDNPSLDLVASGSLNPSDSVLELTKVILDAPHSHTTAAGTIDWSLPEGIVATEPSGVHIQAGSSGLDLQDLLAWIRAFHSDVADDIVLHGLAKSQVMLSGWPPRIEMGFVGIENAALTGNTLRVPVQLAPLKAQYSAKGSTISPLVITFGSLGSLSSLRVETVAKKGPGAVSNVHVTGSVANVRDLIATAGAFGWDLSHGWNLQGPLRCDLRWSGVSYSWRPLSLLSSFIQPVGHVEWGDDNQGASLQSPFLNRPIEQLRGRADWKPKSHHISLSSAQAFGTRWSGTFDRGDTAGGWHFALSAGKLSAADLDLWLNPQWRKSFLDRVLPFLNSRSPANGTPENLRASGKISVDQFTLTPWTARRLETDLRINGRHVEFSNAQVQFYGGVLRGSLDADLEKMPVYKTRIDFSRVDIPALTAVSPSLANLFSGVASGEISFSLRGASRADLASSLECRGAAQVSDAGLRNMNMAESLRAVGWRAGTSIFREASAAFTCGNRKLTFQRLQFLGEGDTLATTGSVDSGRNLDFQLSVFPAGATADDSSASGTPEEMYRFTGPLAEPQIMRVAPSSSPR